MKRKMNVILVLVLLFSAMNLAFVAQASTTPRISISCFEDYQIDNGTLSAQKSEMLELQSLSAFSLTEAALHIAGQATRGRAFDISVPIEDGAFLEPAEANGNYDVLSVLDFGTFIRIVLKEANAPNMLYVDVTTTSEERTAYENYNPGWYRAFIGGDIALEEEVISGTARNSTTTTMKLYSSTNNVYGDVWREYIRIIAIQSYPPTINNSTGGTFCFTLGIRDKWTEYTPYGGSTVTTTGSSLGMNCGEINLSTPKGEFFSSMYACFVGEVSNHTNPLSLGFNLNIPNTPFSITYSYSNQVEGNGVAFYEPFPASTNKVTQAGNVWKSTAYWTYAAAGTGEDVGDRFYVEMKVDTFTAYQVFGSKALNYVWDYHITGTGVNKEYGMAVAMPSISDTISGSVTYTLTAA